MTKKRRVKNDGIWGHFFVIAWRVFFLQTFYIYKIFCISRHRLQPFFHINNIWNFFFSCIMWNCRSFGWNWSNLSSVRVILFTEKEVAVIALSIALGIVIGKLFNQIGILLEINLEKKAIRNFGNWLDQLFLESMERAIMIEVSLDNGKVYIGKIIELDFLRFDRQFIQIALVYSGYRNSQQDIELILDYRSYHRTMILRQAAGVKGLPREISEKDFVVTVSVSSLSSARLFDHDVYHKFKTFGRI